MKFYTKEQVLFLPFALLSMDEYTLRVDDLLLLLNEPERKYKDEEYTIVEKTMGTATIHIRYCLALSSQKKCYVVIDEIICAPRLPF